MFRKAHYIAFGIVALLTLILLNLPQRTAVQLKLAISGMFLPARGASGSTRQLTENIGDAVVPRRELLRQLEQTRLENADLRLQAMRLEEAAHENSRLRQMLQVPPLPPWHFKLARVVGREPANWWRNVTIDVGLRDDITTNAPVVTPQGLVGRIYEVGYTQSRVVLAGDPDCRISVVVEGPTRNNGIIAPASATPLDTTIVDLGYLARHHQLKPGQRVYTSGSGGIFPKGILVGSIVDFRAVDYGLYSEARVKLAVNMNELEEVWVIVP